MTAGDKPSACRGTGIGSGCAWIPGGMSWCGGWTRSRDRDARTDEAASSFGRGTRASHRHEHGCNGSAPIVPWRWACPGIVRRRLCAVASIREAHPLLVRGRARRARASWPGRVPGQLQHPHYLPLRPKLAWPKWASSPGMAQRGRGEPRLPRHDTAGMSWQDGRANPPGAIPMHKQHVACSVAESAVRCVRRYQHESPSTGQLVPAVLRRRGRGGSFT